MLFNQLYLYVLSPFCGKEELDELEVICPYCLRCVEADCYGRCPNCGSSI